MMIRTDALPISPGRNSRWTRMLPSRGHGPVRLRISVVKFTMEDEQIARFQHIGIEVPELACCHIENSILIIVI